jgi:hypothetical protein
VDALLRETEQRDVLEVRTVVLCDYIERFSKVTHRCDIVATQCHNKLSEHYQVFLYLLCRYRHTGQARGGRRVIGEYVCKPARADPQAVSARDDDFGDVNHSHRQALVVRSLHRACYLDNITPESSLGDMRLGRLDSPTHERRRTRLDVGVIECLRSRVVCIGDHECWARLRKIGVKRA